MISEISEKMKKMGVSSYKGSESQILKFLVE